MWEWGKRQRSPWGLARFACSSFQVTDAAFVAVYATEILLKLYADPIAY